MLGSSQSDLHISISRKLPGVPLKVSLRTLAAGWRLYILLFPTKCYPKTRCRNDIERECLRVRVQAAALRSNYVLCMQSCPSSYNLLANWRTPNMHQAPFTAFLQRVPNPHSNLRISKTGPWSDKRATALYHFQYGSASACCQASIWGPRCFLVFSVFCLCPHSCGFDHHSRFQLVHCSFTKHLKQRKVLESRLQDPRFWRSISYCLRVCLFYVWLQIVDNL